MRVGSLFSGIGGLDLGLERAGMTVVWQSEIDPYCSNVLANHWPHVPNLGDVTEVDWGSVERPDLVCGGFPCQPVSLAGARRGQDDERWLWPEFHRCVRALRPRYVLVENVPGLLVRGMGDVLGDLAACGYLCEWDCIPATAVGAPHLRYRVFIVATNTVADARRVGDERWRGSRELEGTTRTGEGEASERQWVRNATGDSGADVADADISSRRSTGGSGETIFGPEAVKRLGRRGSSFGAHWAVEPDVGRVAHGIPRRVDRLRALGNAVVPQVAEWIGRRLMTEKKNDD